MVEKMVFNSSLPRSGSTLLQNILAQNPRFYCSPTSGMVDVLLSVRKDVSTLPYFRAQEPELMKRGFTGLFRGAVTGWYNALTDRPVCVDKSRGWMHYYELLKASFDKPKVLVTVRDLRAIMSSMEKLWRKNQHLADPVDDLIKMNMITVEQRVTFWMNSRPVGIAVLFLMDALQTGAAKNFHFVRFEDLTTKPKEVMKRVYDYLEEPAFEHDFESVDQVTQEDDAHHGIYGDHRIREAVRPVPMDYNEVIGKELAAQLRVDNQAFYKTFYPDAR